MKIQFIVVGWHFDKYPDLVEELLLLKQQNSGLIKVFWTCHREPSDFIKQNFEYKLFPNLGLEDGAYQQALDYLELEDSTILFLIHDDLKIKDWNFINVCLERLQTGDKFIGNGINYPAQINPEQIVRGKKLIEYVKPEAQHIFSDTRTVLTIRESFICTTREALRKIFDFEVIWEEPQPDAEGKFHIGGIGNLQQSLLGYKITKVFGPEKISYLSNTYQDSSYLFEYARGVKV